MATIILGSQWGDEGKGKLTDILCQKVNICARGAGGHNAGHTIEAGGVKYDFHLLPSGLVNPNSDNLIGSGVVFNCRQFFKEIWKITGEDQLGDLDEDEEKGEKAVYGNLKVTRQARDENGKVTDEVRILVSDRCHVNLELHAKVDGLEELELAGGKIGTTKRGIGPSYSTKAARSGIRIHEIFNPSLFEKKLRQLAAGYKKRYGDLLDYDVEKEIQRFAGGHLNKKGERVKGYREVLGPYVVDAVTYLKNAQSQNHKILIEGANALMLDIDYGTYPYVTSSNTGIGGIFTGLAINPTKIDNIVGVVKAYTTRVGEGPFKTEDLGEAGTKLQTIGREVGVSTGRPRRCGWLDLVVVKYSAAVNHYTALNLTKLDVLDTFPTIKVAVAYKYRNEKGELEDVPELFPASLDNLESYEVEYKEFEGWQKPTTSAKTYFDLPKQARAYIEFIEEQVGVPIGWIGTGPKREDMVVKGPGLKV